MSKLRNSRPGTAAVMTAHHLAAACCSAAAMLWLPPTHCLSGWWQSLTGAAPSLLSMWCGSQCLMIESQRTQTFKPEGSKIVNIPKMVYQETPPLRRPCRHWRTHTDTCATWCCCLPSSPGWSPTRRSTTWPRNSSASTSPLPSSLASPSFQRRSGWTLCSRILSLWRASGFWVPVPAGGGVEDWWPVQSSLSRRWNVPTMLRSEVIW